MPPRAWWSSTRNRPPTTVPRFIEPNVAHGPGAAHAASAMCANRHAPCRAALRTAPLVGQREDPGVLGEVVQERRAQPGGVDPRRQLLDPRLRRAQRRAGLRELADRAQRLRVTEIDEGAGLAVADLALDGV